MQCPTQILLNAVSSTEKCGPLPVDKLSRQEELIEDILSKLFISNNPVKSLPKIQNRTSVAEDDLEERSVQIKTDKYPIELKHDSVMGRCLVAAKDIEPGEIFLNDWPLLMAPNAEESGTTCVGCCLVVEESRLQPCLKCGWNVCSIDCSNVSKIVTQIQFSRLPISHLVGNSEEFPTFMFMLRRVN